MADQLGSHVVAIGFHAEDELKVSGGEGVFDYGKEGASAIGVDPCVGGERIPVAVGDFRSPLRRDDDRERRVLQFRKAKVAMRVSQKGEARIQSLGTDGVDDFVRIGAEKAELESRVALAEVGCQVRGAEKEWAGVESDFESSEHLAA